LRIPFHRHLRLELLEDGRVRAPDILELKNHFGTVHGGLLFALGETAAAVAIGLQLAEDGARVHAITRRGAIEYRKPARGAITARASVSLGRAEILDALEATRSVDVPIQVELSDEAAVTVATLDIGFYLGRRRE
jgi:uncharacterized protein (TIGR00369 family)